MLGCNAASLTASDFLSRYRPTAAPGARWDWDDEFELLAETDSERITALSSDLILGRAPAVVTVRGDAVDPADTALVMIAWMHNLMVTVADTAFSRTQQAS